MHVFRCPEIPSFSPSGLESGFKQWRDLGINTIGDLYIDRTFANFDQLKQKYGLHRSNFFRFLQVRTNLPEFATAQPSSLDMCISDCIGHDKMISRLYDKLQSIKPPTTALIKAEWERELGEEISGENWDNGLKEIHYCSINSRHSLILFQIIHRLHYFKTTLHHIFP